MDSIEPHRPSRNNRFDTVVEPFLRQSGLPFAEVLSGETIERAFAQQDGLFAEDDSFSTPLVLWAFLARVLRGGGKGAACAAAVADNNGIWLWSGSPPTRSPIAPVVSSRA